MTFPSYTSGNNCAMLGVTILFATALIGVLGAPKVTLLGGGRIVNGTNAYPGEFPFVASLGHFGRHFCGASILNECYILTAAHCVDGEFPVDLQVVVGTVKLSSGGDRYQVSEIIMHEGYNPDNMYIHDIALLKLNSSIQYSNLVKPGNFPTQMEATPGSIPAKVIGWGYPYSESEVVDHLQEVDIRVYSDEECQDIHYYTLHESNICAGVPEGGRGQCTGDSGGPLIANGLQVGIVSWSIKPCTVKPYPGVFTEVAWYMDWIAQHASQC